MGFDTPEINQAPGLLLDSFRLRYQVYCVERQFLPVSDYPRGVETDEFDNDSIHVGAVDRGGQLAGTARLVLPTRGTLPTLAYCVSTPIEGALWTTRARWVEASRLSVSRSYGSSVENDRSQVFLAVLRALYMASKRIDATHWLVSIERSLQRLLARNGFPFRQMGPQFEYLGPVAPYAMDLRELDQIIASGRHAHLANFATEPGTSHTASAGALSINTSRLTPSLPS
jgi:N-acyl-L-homoserine lactone synthetase